MNLRTYFVAPAIVALAFAYGCKDRTPDADLASQVNPFIGTDFTGNTYPGAQAPFGMVQLSPDNGLPGWDRISGYFHPDSTIAGFSHTHLGGTGAGDLYDISFMPVTFPLSVAEEPLGVHSKFDHATEKAIAGYYAVTLEDYGIDVELTATDRVGIQRYSFPGTRVPRAVILNLAKAMNWDATVATKLHVVDSLTVTGYRFSTGWAKDQRVYFATRFSQAWDSITYDTIPAQKGIGLVATFHFPTAMRQLTVSTALSPVSAANALENLRAEAPTDDFDKACAKTREAWNTELGSILVETDDADLKAKFYTALYRAKCAPTIFEDVNGEYPGPDGKIHRTTADWNNYSTFSLWDTYRAEHPLLTIVDPIRAAHMAKSLLAFGTQQGRLPVWNFWANETDMMIGYHSVPVIVDAYFKGLLQDVDETQMLDLMIVTSKVPGYRGLDDYQEIGYVPTDGHIGNDGLVSGQGENWSMSKTIEYSYDDDVIARFARRIGRQDVAQEYQRRAANWRNVYNPVTGFLQPRRANGKWVRGFRPEKYTEDICESNGWQYLFAPQHQLDTLMNLLGGPRAMEDRLDQMFATVDDANAQLPIFSTGMIGQYAHGNEPDHHVPYLYNMVNRPDRGAYYLYNIMTDLYRNAPDGLCGNEDLGQMSAWFVMSAMGFYPVNPVGGKYEIGLPMFDRVDIPVAGGKKFTIAAKYPEGKPQGHRYIKRVRVNGRDYYKSYLTHDMITGGALVEMDIVSTPQAPWFVPKEK